MGFRFQKSIRIGKFFRINLSHRGIGYSIGMPGTGVSFGQTPSEITRKVKRTTGEHVDGESRIQLPWILVGVLTLALLGVLYLWLVKGSDLFGSKPTEPATSQAEIAAQDDEEEAPKPKPKTRSKSKAVLDEEVEVEEVPKPKSKPKQPSRSRKKTSKSSSSDKTEPVSEPEDS